MERGEGSDSRQSGTRQLLSESSTKLEATSEPAQSDRESVLPIMVQGVTDSYRTRSTSPSLTVGRVQRCASETAVLVDDSHLGRCSRRRIVCRVRLNVGVVAFAFAFVFMFGIGIAERRDGERERERRERLDLVDAQAGRHSISWSLIASASPARESTT